MMIASTPESNMKADTGVKHPGRNIFMEAIDIVKESELKSKNCREMMYTKLFEKYRNEDLKRRRNSSKFIVIHLLYQLAEEIGDMGTKALKLNEFVSERSYVFLKDLR